MAAHDAIYVRQSVDKKDSISIDGQIELCRAEAGDTAVEIYADRGFSGKNIKRPEFARLMRDVEAGNVRRVICYRLDRISRSIADFGAIWETLSGKGVEFVSVSEKFDTSTPVGRAMLYIIMVFAQLERETIAERVKDNYYQRVRRGSWPGGPAPYGFDIQNKPSEGCKLVRNEHAKHVEMIFRAYAAPGASLGSVSRELNAQEVPRASRRKTWDSVALARILHNPAYVKADASVYAYYKSRGVIPANDIEEYSGVCGCILVGQRNANDRKYTDVSDHVLVIGAHEGLVSPSLFLECQAKLSSNKQIKNTGSGKYTWLSGLLKCGECGYSLKVQNDKARDTRYLVCSGRTNLKVCTARHSEKPEDVEAEVSRLLREHIKGITVPPDGAAEPDLDALKAELAVCEEKIGNLIGRLSEASAITTNYINQEVERLDREKTAVLEKLSSTSRTVLPESIKHSPDFDLLSFDEKKVTAAVLIEKILCTTEETRVEWRV